MVASMQLTFVKSNLFAMRNIKFITICVLLFTAISTSYTQAQSGKGNFKAQYPFSVDSMGTIKDGSGYKFGTISQEGVIKNNKGEIVASIDKDRNLVDEKGKKMGKASENGELHNTKGEILYTVKPIQSRRSQVSDKTGKLIAHIHDHYKLQAGSIAHCIQTKMVK
jgi:hypothetical protein